RPGSWSRTSWSDASISAPSSRATSSTTCRLPPSGGPPGAARRAARPSAPNLPTGAPHHRRQARDRVSRMPPAACHRPTFFALFATFPVGLVFLPGCLERRIRVITDPPGATVWLNDTEIGRSPTDTSFTFFGAYDVRVAKPGYETLNTTKKAVAPWY